ncbi:hypothetical protein B0J13DRAFT_523804 [Dactylonectria estremocensis]|uniref:Uncharacterized protein n=1 Tax=Dactylonectria estremocensis TaxID=1079267 RepID=A0A9P9EZN1_9HYPO|nr:hypothetical protein B0J13DRAFT_523804 [Dactylonectria estremocensis]
MSSWLEGSVERVSTTAVAPLAAVGDAHPGDEGDVWLFGLGLGAELECHAFPGGMNHAGGIGNTTHPGTAPEAPEMGLARAGMDPLTAPGDCSACGKNQEITGLPCLRSALDWQSWGLALELAWFFLTGSWSRDKLGRPGAGMDP